MLRFRKKPIVIEAIQFNGSKDNIAEILTLSSLIGILPDRDQFMLSIKTLEGVMSVNLNDWIVKGVSGEFYPCKPKIFKATYDLVEES